MLDSFWGSPSPTAHTQANIDPTLYDTPNGHALIHKLLKVLLYDPDDYVNSGTLLHSMCCVE